MEETMIDPRSDEERRTATARPSRTRTKEQRRWFERYGHLIPWDEPAIVPEYAWRAAGMEKQE